MIRTIWLSTLLAAALASSATAQSPSPADAKKPGGDNKSTAAADPAAAGTAKYTPESLAKQLTELGYGAKVDSEMVEITIKKDGEEYSVWMRFGENDMTVSYVCAGTVKEPERVPNTAWYALLEANETYGPVHFTYNAATKDLMLNRALSLRPIPNDRLDTAIKQFMIALKTTAPLYDPAVFPTTEEAAK